MLGKYGEASSGSMKNLDNGLRDRVLYHQNMLSMNLTAEFYHNPFLAAGSGGGSNVIGASASGATPTMAQSQKMLNSLASASHPQQQHASNGSTTAASVPSPTVPNSASQSLTQYQCQLCQKCFISSAVLTQHMKTHDSNGFVARETGNYVQQQQTVTSAPSPVTAVASSSKTSPPLLTQHNIKSEYVGGTVTHTMGQFVYGMAKQFECPICHKSFMTMVNLNLHMKIHEAGVKPIAAAHMYSQASGGNLLAGGTTGGTYHSGQHHNQQHHTIGPTIPPSSNSTDGVCQICHKTFSTADQFAAHMKIHENEFKNRALYHSSSANANGGDGSTSGPIPTSNGGGVGDHFYASAPPTHQAVHAPPHLDASKGHRCPICHKMSNNIIEHIKQHEGQLTMGGSSTGTTLGVVGSPAPGVVAGYQQTNEDSQSSLEDDSDGGENVRKHECLICHKKFSSSGNLAIHIRVHSGEKPFKCSVCGKGFIQSNNLATHMKTHTGEKPYACTICGKNFSQSNNLKTHIRTHTGEKPYACTICGKRFNQKNNLTTHMRTHQLVCMVCGVQFMHPSDLANHMKFHNDEKPFICSVCNKVYLNLDELTEHMKKTHNQVKPYRCHICDKTFTQSNNLKTHIKTHIFQDPYKCQMCSRSFQKEDDYSQHMLVHTADKPYECTYCGKRFIQSNNLKTHVRTHTGEKPYRCTICAKNFNQKNNLNTHMRIHTGEKPFECTICDKRFNQSNNLNKHIKTHGQEKDQQQQQQAS
ncbi:zinc finger protein 271-like [Anopheles moucheti]|uniref:zinc finger protein 271-like n=1 Tax=Anopheles moucheti TaxID=186751 RepID=UPI0022F0147E|nr:zinc finger protein 271-like [Anopheles moucheti]